MLGKKRSLGRLPVAQTKKPRGGGVRTFLVNSSKGRVRLRKIATDKMASSSFNPPEQYEEFYDTDLDAGALDLDVATATPDLDSVSAEPEKPAQRELYKTKNMGRGAGYLKLESWLSSRDLYLDAVIAHEASVHSESSCCVCAAPRENDLHRCLDCLFPGALCSSCTVQKHRELPFHRIETWNGKFFDKTSLSKLGLRIQLGHHGSHCPNPVRGPERFVVMDSNGYHFAQFDFCNCYTAEKRDMQLLQARLFPASTDRPATAFTFEMLDTCEELSLQGKTNIYDFYNALMNKTTKAMKHPVNKYKDLCIVIRLWRHLLALKRSGRAHDPFGAARTEPGELCVECPACPHPERNLPLDWDVLPYEKRWIYTQFLAVDANFKLKLKNRGFRDVELAPGWSFFVEEDAYQRTVETMGGDEKETNTCRSQHNAILAANIRGTKDYKASGTGAVVCGRHSLICKNGVGDLQRGERYANMDYIVLSVLKHSQARDFVISYDIACQWSKNFEKRVTRFPANLQVDTTNINIRPVIPKFHLPAHGPQCQSRYSLNYLPKVGRTYGEGVESGWANTNGAATSTREMAPGARHENLNDLWGAWNWNKILGFGDYFSRQLDLALQWKEKHRKTLESMSETVPTEVVSKWKSMIEAWNLDPSADDPYSEPPSEMTLSDVRKQFTDEDAAEAKKGGEGIYAVTARSFIVTGLDLEDGQRKFKMSKKLKNTQTSRLAAGVQTKRTNLLKQILQWRRTQDVYMPLVAPLRTRTQSTRESDNTESSSGSDTDTDDDEETPDETDAQTNAEDIQLYLPSQCPQHASAELRSLEVRLRRAQADDALETIRQQRRAIAALLAFKRRNVNGMGNKQNTRIQTLYDRIQGKIDLAKVRYRVARWALHRLDPEAEQLRELKDEDIRGPDIDDDEGNPRRSNKNKNTNTNTRLGQGYHEVSWIWLGAGANTAAVGDESAFRECVRVEWTRAYARVERWEEELQLVCEEMRRVLAFLTWKSKWWDAQRRQRLDVRGNLLLALDAYALKMSAIYLRLASSFALQWYSSLEGLKSKPSWLAEYAYLIADDVEGEGEDDDEDEDGFDTRRHDDGKPRVIVDEDDLD